MSSEQLLCLQVYWLIYQITEVCPVKNRVTFILGSFNELWADGNGIILVWLVLRLTSYIKADIRDDTDKSNRFWWNNTRYRSLWSGPMATDPIWMMSPKLDISESPSHPLIEPVRTSSSNSFCRRILAHSDYRDNRKWKIMNNWWDWKYYKIDDILLCELSSITAMVL